MHESRVIHRDIKPENLIFRDKVNINNFSDNQIVICDFGLASYPSEDGN